MINLSGNFFYHMLFFEGPEAINIARYILQYSKLFVVAIFTLSAIWEFFTQNNYKGVIVRTLFCLIIFASYEKFLIESVKTSFIVSEKILKTVSKDNSIITSYNKAQRIAKEKAWGKKLGKGLTPKNISFFDVIGVMVKVAWHDIIAVFIWILIAVIFILLKTMYSTSFYLLYVFLPIQALLSIFSPLAISLKGALRTYLSLVATPLVVAVIIAIMDNNIEYVTDTTSQYTFSDNIEGLVRLLIIGIVLFFAPSLAASILDGRGNVMVGSRVTQVVSGTLSDMGLRSIIGWGVGAPKGIIKNSVGKLHSGAKSLINKLSPKSKSLNNSNDSERPSSKTDIQAKNLINESKKGKVNLKSYSLKEKAKAIKMARSRPEHNFIPKGTYYNILAELEESKNEKKSKKKQGTNSRRKARPRKGAPPPNNAKDKKANISPAAPSKMVKNPRPDKKTKRPGENVSPAKVKVPLNKGASAKKTAASSEVPSGQDQGQLKDNKRPVKTRSNISPSRVENPPKIYEQEDKDKTITKASKNSAQRKRPRRMVAKKRDKTKKSNLPKTKRINREVAE